MGDSKVGVLGGVCYRKGCDNKAEFIPVSVPSIERDYLYCYYCLPCCNRLDSGEIRHVLYRVTVTQTDGMANYTEWMQERMDDGMNPDILLSELRDIARQWRADKMSSTLAMGEMASKFNDLDEWLLDGRPFPLEWKKGRAVD